VICKMLGNSQCLRCCVQCRKPAMQPIPGRGLLYIQIEHTTAGTLTLTCTPRNQLRNPRHRDTDSRSTTALLLVRHFLRCAVHSRCSSAKSRCGSCCAYDSAACASSCFPMVSLLRWLATIASMVSRLNSGCPAKRPSACWATEMHHIRQTQQLQMSRDDKTAPFVVAPDRCQASDTVTHSANSAPCMHRMWLPTLYMAMAHASDEASCVAPCGSSCTWIT
jgi:hypothetical protein